MTRSSTVSAGAAARSLATTGVVPREGAAP
jgi:hypothetical protein